MTTKYEKTLRFIQNDRRVNYFYDIIAIEGIFAMEKESITYAEGELDEFIESHPNNSFYVRYRMFSSNYKFDKDMYNNIIGSLIITAYILNMHSYVEHNPSVDEIRRKWSKLKGKWSEYTIDNLRFFEKGLKSPNDFIFLEKILKSFGLPVPYGRFVLSKDGPRGVFLPYVDGMVLPILENGDFPFDRDPYFTKDYIIYEDHREETK